MQLTLTLKMTTAQVVETSVTVNNSPIQDYVHPDDHTQPTYEMTPGFQTFHSFTLNIVNHKLSPTGKVLHSNCFVCDDLFINLLTYLLFYLRYFLLCKKQN